jgi:hypothetical protein
MSASSSRTIETFAIGAIRALERESYFRPYEAQARIFIVDDAEKMNDPRIERAFENARGAAADDASDSHHFACGHAAPDDPIEMSDDRFAPVPCAELEKHLVDNCEFSAKTRHLRREFPAAVSVVR